MQLGIWENTAQSIVTGPIVTRTPPPSYSPPSLPTVQNPYPTTGGAGSTPWYKTPIGILGIVAAGALAWRYYKS